jgi:hypothetical protein
MLLYSDRICRFLVWNGSRKSNVGGHIRREVARRACYADLARFSKTPDAQTFGHDLDEEDLRSDLCGKHHHLHHHQILHHHQYDRQHCIHTHGLATGWQYHRAVYLQQRYLVLLAWVPCISFALHECYTSRTLLSTTQICTVYEACSSRHNEKLALRHAGALSKFPGCLL